MNDRLAQELADRQRKGVVALLLPGHLRIQPYCCPCCRQSMVASNTPVGRNGKTRKGKPLRTRGHLLPKSRSAGYRRFIYQCFVCNNNQADNTFYSWLIVLISQRDPRAHYVFQTLMALLELGVEPKELQ